MNIAGPSPNTPVLQEIRRRASLEPVGLSFEQFMEIALYHPISGYYTQPRPIGKRGDFFTSVSVGPCFGELLTRQIRQIHELWNTPAPFCVIEQGAHSGELASDILRTWPDLPYRLVEPLPSLSTAQRETLHSLNANIRHVSSLRDLREENAVFVCNELLDAFPVRRLHFTGHCWEEWRVVAEQDSLQLRSFPLQDTGFELPGWIPASAPDGFTVEVCPTLRSWLADLTTATNRVIALIIDYGLTREERFSPERREGTLRAYQKHRLIPNPLESPGERDLTSHVDFTTLIEEARRLGWDVLGFTDQARFLTGVAAPWLHSLEGQADHPSLNQFKTLTHPSMMGRSFKVLALSRNTPLLKLDGFQFGTQL